MKTTPPISAAQMIEFATLLVQIKHRAFELGLLRTGHALDKATQAVGWECEDILLGRQQYPGLDGRRPRVRTPRFGKMKRRQLGLR